MIILHHLENSRSQRVLWLLEALKVEYKVEIYKRDPKTNLAPKSLLKINPMGKSPVIQDEDITLPESGAIFEYLLNKYDRENKLHPKPEDKNYKDYLFWLHFAEGSLMWPLVIRLLHSKVIEKVPFFIRPIAKGIFNGIEGAYLAHTIKNSFDYIEAVLGRNKYFLGESLSAVDILMSFPLEASCSGRASMESYPNIINFVKNIKENTDYKKAIEVGGPYVY